MTKLQNMKKSRVIIIISSYNSTFALQKPYKLGFTNSIIFQNNSFSRRNFANGEVIKLELFDDIFKTDYFKYFEKSWPYFSINHTETTDNWLFPMLMEKDGQYSGILIYMSKTLQDYLNSRMEYKINYHDLKSRREEKIYLDYTKVNEFFGRHLFISRNCYMLPVVHEILIHEYLVKAFTTKFWVFLIFFNFCLSALLRSVIHKDTFRCIFEVFSISCWTLHLGLKEVNLRKRLLYLQLFLYGFIIWNLYSAKMQSYLASPNRGRSLKTFEDIRKEHIKLWTITSSEKSILFETDFPELLYSSFEMTPTEVDFIAPRELFKENVYSLNNEFGYLVPDYFWSFINLKQSQLIRKIFSFSDLCPRRGFINPFSMDYEFIRITEVIEIFYMRVLESGLNYIWLQFSYFDTKFKVLKNIESNFIILDFKYFQNAWIVAFVGVTFSTIVFILELIKHYFMKSMK